MRYLEALSEGDRFRPAYGKMRSLNGKVMYNHTTYKVHKAYSMSPYTYIVYKDGTDPSDFFSLPPRVPILLPREPSATDKEIAAFIKTPFKRKCVVGYRLLWDGVVDISGIAYPQEIVFAKIMFFGGKKEYSVTELNELLNAHYQNFASKPPGTLPLLSFRGRCKHMIEIGIIEDIIDDAPISQRAAESNVQGVFYGHAAARR